VELADSNQTEASSEKVGETRQEKQASIGRYAEWYGLMYLARPGLLSKRRWGRKCSRSYLKPINQEIPPINYPNQTQTQKQMQRELERRRMQLTSNTLTLQTRTMERSK
jgi:hypothetical protein